MLLTYSDLAAELGISNPRTLNYVLGAIAQATVQVGELSGIDIPPIQFMVVKKGLRIPGDAVGWAARGEASRYASLSRREKRLLAEQMAARIAAFPRWLDFLAVLGLEPLQPIVPSGYGFSAGRGEGEAHKLLKELIAERPELVGFTARARSVAVEHHLPSGDSVDVLITGVDRRLGVEVKAAGVPEAEVLRGLFQCVKYRALLEAQSAISDQLENRSVLALGGAFPPGLTPIRNALGVEVYDELAISG